MHQTRMSDAIAVPRRFGRSGATIGRILAGYALGVGVGRLALYRMFEALPLLVVLCLRNLHAGGFSGARASTAPSLATT